MLHRIGFVYKKADQVPAKADPEKQRDFIKAFNNLMAEKSPDVPVLFVDAVHPTYNSQPAYGWILKGKKVEIPATSNRQHLNLHGAVNAETQEELVTENVKMTAESSLELMHKIENNYPNAPYIYVLLDNAPYHHSKDLQAYAQVSRIRLIYLPTYSPNLNIIERLWRFMYKHVLYNRYFESIGEFRRELLFFFERLTEEFSASLRSLLALNFVVASSKEKRGQVLI